VRAGTRIRQSPPSQHQDAVSQRRATFRIEPHFSERGVERYPRQPPAKGLQSPDKETTPVSEGRLLREE